MYYRQAAIGTGEGSGVRAALVVMMLVPGATASAGEMPRPRVFMTAEEIRSARARGAADDIQKRLRQALLQRADEALQTPLRYTQRGGLIAGLRNWPTQMNGQYGELLQMRKDGRDTDVLAVAYAVTGQRKYAERAWKNVHGMLSIYKSFGSYHPKRKNNDLAAAHCFMAIATTWDLCADVAPEATKKLVLTEGVRRARDMYVTAASDWIVNKLPVPFETPGVHRTRGPQNRNIFAMIRSNHCWVDVGLLGCLALALEDEDVSPAGAGSGPKDWLRFATHFFSYIAGIMPEDGSYPESRVYGAPYAFEGGTPFLRALKRAKGVDIFAKSPFFHNFAYGRLYAVWDHAGHTGISNFGDGPENEWHSAAWVYAVAAATRDPVIQWSANHWTRRRPAFDETAWQYLAYDPSLPEKAPAAAGMPKALILEDMSHVHVRGGADPWGKGQWVLSFRASLTGKKQPRLHKEGKVPYVSAWHMHPSRNAFILAVDGRPLVTRSTRGASGTRHYSVLQVGGSDQQSLGSSRASITPLEGVVDFDATDLYTTFSSEIGRVYPDLDLYRRRVVCLEPGTWLVADCARAPKPVRMDHRLHLGRDVKAEFGAAAGDSPPRVTGTHAGKPFAIDVLSAAEVSVRLESPPGPAASRTLRYGPAGSATESRVCALVRVGDAPPARPVAGKTPNMIGAFVAGPRPIAVIVSDAAEMKARPASAGYVVPRSASTVRHFVTGLAGGRRCGVRAKTDGESVTVTIAGGSDVTASPHGTIVFDLAPGGKARAVKVTPQPRVQDVAAALVKGKAPPAPRARTGGSQAERPATGQPPVDDAKAAREREASKLYRSARSAERAGMKDLARTLYERLVKEHPNSPLAEKARKKIE